MSRRATLPMHQAVLIRSSLSLLPNEHDAVSLILCFPTPAHTIQMCMDELSIRCCHPEELLPKVPQMKGQSSGFP